MKTNTYSNMTFTSHSQMPKILPYLDSIPVTVTGFHRARAKKKQISSFVHFYVKDRHFDCLWNRPANYLN